MSSNIRGEFNWGKNGKYLSEKLRNLLNEKVLGDVEDVIAGYILSKAQEEAVRTAKHIQDELNKEEAAHPRLDPALKNLRTDQWKVFAYFNYDSNGKQKRLPNGQFDFKFRFVAINMQKPFYYTFDFTDYNYRFGGKVMMNAPVYSLSDKERKRLTKKGAYRNLPTGYQEVTETRLFYKQNEPHKSGKEKKVMGRMNRTVGNLAAVRLAQEGNIVVPKKAKRIVFWVNHAKRLDEKGNAQRGRSMGGGGYVFVQARMYNIGGHTRYKKKIDSIIDSEVNTFMDKLW